MNRRMVALFLSWIIIGAGTYTLGAAELAERDRAAASATTAPAATLHPHMIVHKTDPYSAPENTLPGIDAAKADGGDTVEMDVNFTKSSYPVVIHDATLDRTTNCSGAVASKWYYQIKSCKAQDYAPWKTNSKYSNVHIPTAWLAVKQAVNDHLDVVLHLKAVPFNKGGWDRIAHYIDYFHYYDHVTIMTDPAKLKTLRSWHPELNYIAIEWPSNVASSTAIRTGQYLKSIGASGYAFQWKGINSADVAYWHSFGLKVYTWTTDVNSEDTSANWGKVNNADYLITNHPGSYESWATN